MKRRTYLLSHGRGREERRRRDYGVEGGSTSIIIALNSAPWPSASASSSGRGPEARRREEGRNQAYHHGS